MTGLIWFVQIVHYPLFAKLAFRLGNSILWSCLTLLAIVWLSTAFLQVPQHSILEAGFNAEAHRKLVSTNWIRTVLWSTRAILLSVFLAKNL